MEAIFRELSKLMNGLRWGLTISHVRGNVCILRYLGEDLYYGMMIIIMFTSVLF